MSPTSYRTAPPRVMSVTTLVPFAQTLEPLIFTRGWRLRCLFRVLFTLTRRYQLGRINRFVVHLHFHDLSIFPDQEINALRSLDFRRVHAIPACDFPAPVAEQRKSDADLLSKGIIGERAIHAHTQDLGICFFQRLQVLLEVFHLLRSAT